MTDDERAELLSLEGMVRNLARGGDMSLGVREQLWALLARLQNLSGKVDGSPF